mgnify:CR=1 FL=1
MKNKSKIMKHKVLTVRQPWSYLICSGIKDIENRTWELPEKYKGERVLIHASGTTRVNNRYSFKMFTEQQLNKIKAAKCSMDLKQLYLNECGFGRSSLYIANELTSYSAIIGSVEIVDCVINHPSIWAEYTRGWPSDPKVIYHWVLANPILFDNPILNVKGKLGFWDYDLEEECDKHKQKQALIDMMIGDEEIGLYDDNQKQQ